MQTNPNRYLTGWRVRLYQAGVLLRACRIALQAYPNLRDAWLALRGELAELFEEAGTKTYRGIEQAASLYTI